MNNQEIKLFVKTPQGIWETSFTRSTLISQVILAIINHFGFASNGKYELKLEKDPNLTLEPNKSLMSYGIQTHHTLILVDFGQAV